MGSLQASKNYMCSSAPGSWARQCYTCLESSMTQLGAGVAVLPSVSHLESGGVTSRSFVTKEVELHVCHYGGMSCHKCAAARPCPVRCCACMHLMLVLCVHDCACGACMLALVHSCACRTCDVFFGWRAGLLQVIDMPLLFETGTHKLTSSSVVVACTPQLQVRQQQAEALQLAAALQCMERS